MMTSILFFVFCYFLNFTFCFLSFVIFWILHVVMNFIVNFIFSIFSIFSLWSINISSSSQPHNYTSKSADHLMHIQHIWWYTTIRGITKRCDLSSRKQQTPMAYLKNWTIWTSDFRKLGQCNLIFTQRFVTMQLNIYIYICIYTYMPI